MSPSEALSILELTPNATSSEIKGAYRDLVKIWHPDRFGSDLPLRRRAEERLKSVNVAYQCLQGYIPVTNPDSRETAQSGPSSPSSRDADPPNGDRQPEELLRQDSPPDYAQPAGRSTNTAAALAYITIISAVIFLVLKPYKRNTFIRFHAWQCIVLTLVDIAGDLVFGFMGRIGLMVRALLGLLLFVFWLIAMIKASQGDRYHIPIVGDLAESFAARVW